MRGDSIFLSAITDSDGEVDSGYLGGYIVTFLVLGAIPFMVLGAFVSMVWAPEHKFPAQELGVGIGAVVGGYGGAMAGVGVFKRGDK